MHGWICVLLCVLVIVCVAGVLIAPNVDLPYTTLKSIRAAHALVARLGLVGVLWLLAFFNLRGLTGSHFTLNTDPDNVHVCTIQFSCAFLC